VIRERNHDSARVEVDRPPGQGGLGVCNGRRRDGSYAAQAHALVIDAYFSGTLSSSTGATQSQIETTIQNAATAVASLYSNPGTINILFATQSMNSLGESETAQYTLSYSAYTSALAADAAAHPANTTLAAAVAHLSSGNSDSIISATPALLSVGLGLSGYGPNIGIYDGIILLSSTQPLDYTNRNPTNGMYDAMRVIEHEIDEVLGGGGQGSTLNAVAACGLDNADNCDPQTDGNANTSYDMGPLDLYRYACGSTTPSFTTSPGANACLSVNGGAADIVQFNQDRDGDYGDFANESSGCADCEFPTTSNCPDYVQDAFSCPDQAADETTSSPEYQMMEAIGYDPAVPEPASALLLSAGVGGTAILRGRRRARHLKVPATLTAAVN